MTKSANSRTADHEIESLFLERWSPRAFTEEEISEADLFSMFEAARHANRQRLRQPRVGSGKHRPRYRSWRQTWRAKF